MVFVLTVTATIPVQVAEEWIARWKALAAYVRSAEPRTLTYEMYDGLPKEGTEATTTTRTFFILERYVQKEDLEAHQQSDAFKAFVAWVSEEAKLPEGAMKFDEYAVEHVVEHGVAQAQKPSDKQRVLVFCGARPGSKPVFMEHAKRLGEEIGRRGWQLIYGGGSVGLMGELARGVLAAGGTVTGIIPRALVPREVSGGMLGDVILTDGMSDRKETMFKLATMVISLPGGFGTLDEALEALTLYQLGAIKKRIGFVNSDGYYDPLFNFFESSIASGFVEPTAMQYFVSAGEPVQVLDQMLQYDQAKHAAELDWSK